MNISKIKNRVLWVVATIVLGAIGSGCWEIALKPAGIWLIVESWTFILSIFNSLSNAFYTEVARGRVGRFDQFFWGTAAGVGFGVFSGILISIILDSKKILKDQIRNFLSQNSFLKMVFLVLISSLLISIGTKSGFVLIKISDYEQMLNISSSVVSYEIHTDYVKRFALIECAEDYELLMKDMAKVISDNKIKIPSALKEYSANMTNSADAKNRAAD